ncbi:hypothetical protein AGDE_16387 [Angomonas deanei]|uniref:Uncharacterized protein n=1 Tax=Angomonas deanei TaxID=59799 RepID=A0A7G2C3L1_9TRYP|nr:hypothetical protein AGDE_16387 [Angomonas deanei]CAD2213854.1 hypothetical protein, conserved [Angomonas deanei]|eukprot:EPY17166.1 hypothetical protein AGDE_16387 [Angomonas deanei]
MSHTDSLSGSFASTSETSLPEKEPTEVVPPVMIVPVSAPVETTLPLSATDVEGCLSEIGCTPAYTRATLLAFNAVALVLAVLSVVAPFSILEKEGVTTLCPQDGLHRSCSWRSMLDSRQYQHVYALKSGLTTFAFIGAILMEFSFLVFVPALVLSAVFLYLNRVHSRQEQQDTANETLSTEDRRYRALTRVYYDVITIKALFATTLVSCVCSFATTVLYFIQLSKDEGVTVAVGPMMALMSTVLYLAALLLIPVCKVAHHDCFDELFKE